MSDVDTPPGDEYGDNVGNDKKYVYRVCLLLEASLSMLRYIKKSKTRLLNGAVD